MIKHHMLDPARIEDYIFKPCYELKKAYKDLFDKYGPFSAVTYEYSVRTNIYSNLIDALDLYNEFKEWESEQDDKTTNH